MSPSGLLGSFVTTGGAVVVIKSWPLVTVQITITHTVHYAITAIYIYIYPRKISVDGEIYIKYK